MLYRTQLFLLLTLLISANSLAQHPASFSVNDLNGENGFTMHGLNETDWLGYAVSDAGDINDDGIADMAVSSLNHDGGGEDAGAVYVIFGTDQGFSATIDLSTLDGSNGFMIMGEAADDQFGHSISNVGNINGDGVNDILLGAHMTDNTDTNAGSAYVIYGNDVIFADEFESSP